MNGQLFTAPSTWDGGFYELGIFLPDGSDETIRAVLIALWSHPAVEGCYLDPTREPADQPRIDPSDPGLPVEGHLMGMCTLPNQKRVACLSIISLIDDTDLNWLYFSIPMGALSTAYPVGGYPFAGPEPLDWRMDVDSWLVALGRHLYREVRFPLGLVGHEVEFKIRPADIAVRGIPETRWEGYLWPKDDTLNWYPPNLGAPFTFDKRQA